MAKTSLIVALTAILAFSIGPSRIKPDFSISATPHKATITPGANAVYTVIVTPVGNWTNAVELTLDGLPAQSTAQFLPNPIPLGSTTSTLTISNTADISTGKYKLTIRARVITRNPTRSSHRKTKCRLRITSTGQHRTKHLFVLRSLPDTSRTTEANDGGCPMKNLIHLLSLSLGLSLCACRHTITNSQPVAPTSPAAVVSTQLTPTKAQVTVQKWVNDAMGGGSVAVLDLQTTPNNTAEARLRFSRLRYIENGASKEFSGKGFAVFTHYLDGRWVLTQVATINGPDSVIRTALIEVK